MPRAVTVKIGADITDLKAKLREGGRAVRDFRGEMDRAARGGQLDAVADQAAGLGVALLGTAGMAVKFSAQFEKAMSGVKAATRASGRELEQLRQAALQAGKDTAYSATEAAQAIAEMSKASVSAGNILGGGLKGALNLAAAGQMDVAEAAELAASAMTQFKLKGADIPHIADLLAAGAGKAQGTVADLGLALNQSGLIAAQTGLTIEDTTGALAAFANAGLTGSDAGTSFKTMLQALQAPSGQTRKLMDDLGISAYDVQGNFIGIAGLAQQLKDKLAGLTPELRANAMAQIFGSDAVRAASVLYEQGAAGVQKWIGAVNDSGYAAETARIQTDNLIGDLERLKGSLETMAIEAGSGANGGLRILAQGTEALVDQFADLPPAIGSTVTVLAALGGTAVLAGAGWVKMRRSNADALEELRNAGPAGEKAAQGLQSVTKWAGRAALAFVAFEVASAAISAFQDDLNPQIEAMAQSLATFGATGETAGETARVLGSDLESLDGQFQILANDTTKNSWARGLQGGLESLIPPLKGADSSLARTKERIGAMDQALAQLVQGGKTADAKQAFDRLAQSLATGGVSMDEFKRQFPQYAAALDVANAQTAAAAGETQNLAGALGEGAKAQDEYANATDAAAAATRGERAALVSLAEHMRAETDPVFGLLDAQKKLAEAQNEAAAATRKHGKDSAEAKAATRDLALAAIDLQEKAGALGETFDGKMTPALRSTLKAAGLTDTEINGLERQFRDAKKAGDNYSKKYEANVSLTGYNKVEGQLDRLAAYQQALKKGMPVGFHGPVFSGGKGYHDGGRTAMVGEFEPAGVVHGDEFVVRKKSRQKFEATHPGALDYLNRYGELPIPGYVSGGMVWPYRTTVAGTRVPSRQEAANAVMPDFGNWPSSPSAQRGDSGVWRRIVALIRGTGPMSGSFGNGYRPGDPKWHGSGRAVDWMGFNQDGLASFLAARRPLELIHRTKNRDYAYTRGRNRGSFNEALMEAHRNHIHIAMRNGGVIGEHIVGVGRSGRTYEFGEAGPEMVIPGYAGGGLVNVEPKPASSPTGFVPTGTRLDTIEAALAAKDAIASLTEALKQNGRVWSSNTQKGRDNRQALISGIRAAQQAAIAKYNETGSVKAANKVYSDYLKQLDKTLKAMGVNAKQRRELLKAYSEQPKYDLPDATTGTPKNSSGRVRVVTDQIAVEEALAGLGSAWSWQKPTFNVKSDTGRAELQQLFAFLSAAQTAAQSMFEVTGNQNAAIEFYNGYIAQLRDILAKSGLSKARIDELLQAYGRITLEQPNRWGGVYERAGGGLRHAQIASGGRTRYAWAEAETGGEAFIPRLGDKARSVSIWRHVGEQWLNQPVWHPGSTGAPGGGRPVVVEATIPITLGSEVICRQVRIEVDAAVGQIVDATVYQTA